MKLSLVSLWVPERESRKRSNLGKETTVGPTVRGVREKDEEDAGGEVAGTVSSPLLSTRPDYPRFSLQ